MFWSERFEATKQYELLGPLHKKKRGMFPVKRIGGRQYRGNAAIMASKFKDVQRSSQTSDAGFLQQRSERSVSNFSTSCMMSPSHNEGDSSINEHSIEMVKFQFRPLQVILVSYGSSTINIHTRDDTSSTKFSCKKLAAGKDGGRHALQRMAVLSQRWVSTLNIEATCCVQCPTTGRLIQSLLLIPYWILLTCHPLGCAETDKTTCFFWMMFSDLRR